MKIKRVLVTLVLANGFSSGLHAKVEGAFNQSDKEGNALSLSSGAAKALVLHLLQRLDESEIKFKLTALVESGEIEKLSEQEVNRLNRQLVEYLACSGCESKSEII